MKYYTVIRKDGIIQFNPNMDETEGIRLREIRSEEKEKIPDVLIDT